MDTKGQTPSSENGVAFELANVGRYVLQVSNPYTVFLRTKPPLYIQFMNANLVSV